MNDATYDDAISDVMTVVETHIGRVMTGLNTRCENDEYGHGKFIVSRGERRELRAQLVITEIIMEDLSRIVWMREKERLRSLIVELQNEVEI